MASDRRDAEVLDEDLPGTPRYGLFAGVLEGGVEDAASLRNAAARIERLGVVGCDLEVDGGRFSFLFDEAPVPGERLDAAARESLVEGLQAVVAASARPAEVESTLRCSLVYGADVVETLFGIVGPELRGISRRRPLEASDRVAASTAGDLAPSSALESLGGTGRRHGVVVLLLLALGGVLLAWQSGYLSLLRDGLYASDAEALASTAGPFGETLELTLESRFATYECTVARGARYPITAEDVEALLRAAVTAEDRAAATAVADGDTIWIRLLTEEGETVEAASVSLRSLLTDPEGTVQCKLRARLRGRRVDLALDSGLEDERKRGPRNRSGGDD